MPRISNKDIRQAAGKARQYLAMGNSRRDFSAKLLTISAALENLYNLPLADVNVGRCSRSAWYVAQFVDTTE